MKIYINEVYKEIRPLVNCTTMYRLLTAVKQEKAGAHIEALKAKSNPTVESLSEYLECELASFLQEAFEDGSLSLDNYVKDNRDTLRLISKGAAHGFINLLAELKQPTETKDDEH